MRLEKFKWMPRVENFCSITQVNLQSVSEEVSQGITPKHSVLSSTTSLTLNSLLTNIKDVKHTTLENRTTIDFLLLMHKHNCKDFDSGFYTWICILFLLAFSHCTGVITFVQVCLGKLSSCNPQYFLIPCLCLFYYSQPKLEAVAIATHWNRMKTVTD